MLGGFNLLGMTYILGRGDTLRGIAQYIWILIVSCGARPIQVSPKPILNNRSIVQ